MAEEKTYNLTPFYRDESPPGGPYRFLCFRINGEVVLSESAYSGQFVNKELLQNAVGIPVDFWSEDSADFYQQVHYMAHSFLLPLWMGEVLDTPARMTSQKGVDFLRGQSRSFKTLPAFIKLES